MNIYSVKRRLTAVYNSIGKYIWKKPTVKSIDETIDYIREHNCSVSRFGDGELEMIIGYGNGFQNSNRELGDRLQQILKQPVDNHIVCLADIFGDLSALRDSSAKYNKTLLSKRRKTYLNMLDLNRVYYNTFFTRFYDMFKDKSRSHGWAEKIKQMFVGAFWLLKEDTRALAWATIYLPKPTVLSEF